MLQEFKTFAMKGNVMDMVVGIIIGTAFGKIINSLVADIIMPPMGVLIGGIDFSRFVITLKAGSKGVEAVTINYGVFINTILNFLIISFAMFFVVKQMNKLKKAKETTPAEPTEDILLLREIRDSLKQ